MLKQKNLVCLLNNTFHHSHTCDFKDQNFKDNKCYNLVVKMATNYEEIWSDRDGEIQSQSKKS